MLRRYEQLEGARRQNLLDPDWKNRLAFAVGTFDFAWTNGDRFASSDKTRTKAFDASIPFMISEA
ncbi:hypothetical protein AJ88_20940 [Mesorhizobium amorphae CCBAU 01583]|nr:hypothetical protein AJ88_20940 [Mesorhizobium amorphae CCBAU 01583]